MSLLALQEKIKTAQPDLQAIVTDYEPLNLKILDYFDYSVLSQRIAKFGQFFDNHQGSPNFINKFLMKCLLAGFPAHENWSFLSNKIRQKFTKQLPTLDEDVVRYFRTAVNAGFFQNVQTEENGFFSELKNRLFAIYKVNTTQALMLCLFEGYKGPNLQKQQVVNVFK